MDGKKLATILPTVVGIGFCVVEGFKILFLMDSAPAPNAATGHTEPALFAPAVSTDWSYITPTQITVLIVVTGAVLLLAAAMFALQVWGKFDGPSEPQPESKAEQNTAPHVEPPPRPPQASHKGGAFGRRPI